MCRNENFPYLLDFFSFRENTLRIGKTVRQCENNCCYMIRNVVEDVKFLVLAKNFKNLNSKLRRRFQILSVYSFLDNHFSKDNFHFSTLCLEKNSMYM